ncbi:hypothetical protein MTR_8g105650 [Medicago truncatula]|uniref:Uncharacterized protein n=1 Tax=Medicago truncatula TaxID=3880 RepID=G7LBG0_MEDTR|nr:hypothetical protein MTR_8g105650 [Medicago truncatula]
MILMELRTHPLKIKRSITMLDFDGFVISENTDYSGGIMIAWKQGSSGGGTSETLLEVCKTSGCLLAISMLSQDEKKGGVAFYDHHGMQGLVVDSPFQFESIWQTHDYFKMDLIRWWNHGHDLIEKLSKVEVELKMWRTINFGSVIKKKELLACLGDNKKKTSTS